MAPMRPFVDHIIVAEFDIDKGSSVSHQYPHATGTEESVLAELMLPDGAHNREEDWTVFFLNQCGNDDSEHAEKDLIVTRPSSLPPAVPSVMAYVYSYNEIQGGWDMISEDRVSIELRPEAFVITTEPAARRLQANPDLKNKSMEPLFHCVISEDIAMGFRFDTDDEEKIFETHCNVLRAYVASAVTVEKNNAKTDTTTTPFNTNRPFLYCLNLLRTKRIDGARRGARMKSMAVCTRYPFIHVFKPLLLLALENYFKNPEAAVLKDLFNAVNSIDAEIPIMSMIEKKILRTSAYSGESLVISSSVKYMNVPIPIRLPYTMLDDEVGDVAVIPLIQKFGREIMTIYNGVLQQRRIIFLGHNHPSNDVANYVLATCRLVCPPLRDLVRRTFPYTNLANLQFLEYPGYVVGVTNPVFEQNQQWWDVLCNMTTGKVTVTGQPDTPPAQQAADTEFYREVSDAINGHLGDEYIRILFQENTQRLVDITCGDAEFADVDSRRRELDVMQWRVDKFVPTLLCSVYKADREQRLTSRAIYAVDMERYINKLRICKALSEHETISIFKDMVQHVVTEVEVKEFLSFLPATRGGLYPVAVHLFHPSEDVRNTVVALFSNLSKIKQGANCLNGLNSFLKAAYDRSASSIRAQKEEANKK